MATMQELKERLEELRDLYFRATPEQRYRVALSRLKTPARPSTTLVDHVSAIEGFARSIVLDSERKNGTDVQAAYDRLRWVGGVPLLRDHLTVVLGKQPDEIFGADDWTLFLLAVDYRNLLVHEAATLREGYCIILTEACTRVLKSLADISGVRGAG